MKLKYKLRAAILAALSGLTLVATTLTASAAYGNNIGGSSSSYTNGSTPFSILGKSDAFAWRVNLYVSANPDGKLNKNDIIGSTQLPLVGSLLCTSSNNAANNGFTTYIQTNYTDEGRTSFSSHGVTPGTLSYTLLTLAKFDPLMDNYLDASGNTVAIAKSGDISLFNNQYKSPTNFDNIQKMHFIKNNILHNFEKRIKFRKMQTIFPTTENLSKNSI